MRKIFTAVSVILFSASAFAQGGEKPAKPEKPEKAEKAAAAPAPEAKPAEMAPPKPSDEIKALTKDMQGVWRCDGKVTMGGNEMPSKGKVTFRPDLDGWFIAGRMESPKTKQDPVGYKSSVMIGYDSAQKMFIRTAQDSMGGTERSTSKGWEGDVQTWNGKGMMMGQEMDVKETITRKGPKEVEIAGSMGPAQSGVSWSTTCKK